MSGAATTVWFSLRRRLLALLLGGVTVAWLVTMIFSYIDAHHEVDELFDAQLAQAAQTLLALASHDEGEYIEDLGDVAHKYQRRLRFQIVIQENKNVRTRIQYQGIDTGTAEDGRSATVGLDTSSSANTVSFNSGLLYDGLSVRPK